MVNAFLQQKNTSYQLLSYIQTVRILEAIRWSSIKKKSSCNNKVKYPIVNNIYRVKLESLFNQR